MLGVAVAAVTRRGGRLAALTAVAIVALATAGCGSGISATSSTRPGATTASPISTTAPSASASADRCAVTGQSPPSGTIAASFATALAFAPDGRLFYAERAGTVRVWQNGAAHTFATVPTATTERGGGYSERGLLGLAISPTFTTDRYVYAFYSDQDRQHQHVIRWRDCDGNGGAGTVIITLPSGNDCCHKGGRIAFGTDGKLYVTLGEEHVPSAAQNTGDVRGKLLRYNPDGSVPADNPFGGSNPVWAYGLRNPFGLAVAADGQMAVTSNGPSGDDASPGTGYDTLILSVARGAGYQWPLCYGYSHPLTGGSGCSARVGPDWSSETATVVPTGLAFIDSSGPAAMAGHLVFCTYEAGMRVVTPGSPHANVATGPAQCRLAVTQGPDHAVYFSDTGHVYRQS